MTRRSTLAIRRQKGERMVTKNLRLPASFVRKVGQEAEEREVTFADLVVEAFALRPVKPLFPDTPEEAAARKAPRE